MSTKWVRLALCLVVSGVCLYLAVRGMDFARTVQELKKSSPMPILGAVFFLFLSYWIRAYRWSYLLLPVKQITTDPLFRSTVIGFMGNYLFPFRAGEVMRAVSIGQNQNISKAAALGSIVLERVFDGIVISLTPFLVLATVEFPPWVTRVNIAFLVLYVLGLLAFSDRDAARMDRSLDRAGNGRIADIFRPTGEVEGGGISPRDEGHQLRRRAVADFSIFFHLLVFSWLVFLSPIRGSRSRILFLGGAGYSNGNRTWGNSSGSTRHVGNFEYFTVLGLALFGITQEAAFAYALLAHICQFIPVTVVGLFFALRNGFHQQVEAVGEV